MQSGLRSQCPTASGGHVGGASGSFAKRFGEVTTAHPTVPALAGHPEVLDLDDGRTSNSRVIEGDASAYTPRVAA